MNITGPITDLRWTLDTLPEIDASGRSGLDTLVKLSYGDPAKTYRFWDDRELLESDVLVYRVWDGNRVVATRSLIQRPDPTVWWEAAVGLPRDTLVYATRLCVAAAYRRQGLARRLYEKNAEIAGPTGFVTGSSLFTAAMRIYRRAGARFYAGHVARALGFSPGTRPSDSDLNELLSVDARLPAQDEITYVATAARLDAEEWI